MKAKNTAQLIVLSLLLTATVFSGCKKTTYNKLTDEEMLWLVYKNNEVLRFKSGSRILTYYVTLRTKAYDIEGDTYNEFTNAHFLQINDTTAIFPEDSNGDLLIYKSDAGLKVTFTWPHFPLINSPLTSMIPALVNIGGVNYPDVFVLNGTPLADTRFYFTKVWVSKSRGVLQLEDLSGNTWIRNF